MKADESCWKRLTAYLRFERRRAAVTPVMLLLGGVALFALLAARVTLRGPGWREAVLWPYWVTAAVCVGAMVAISALIEEPADSDADDVSRLDGSDEN